MYNISVIRSNGVSVKINIIKNRQSYLYSTCSRNLGLFYIRNALSPDVKQCYYIPFYIIIMCSHRFTLFYNRYFYGVENSLSGSAEEYKKYHLHEHFHSMSGRKLLPFPGWLPRLRTVSALFASYQTGYHILGLWVSQRAQRTNNKLDSVGVGISRSLAGVSLSWLVSARFVCLLH